MGAARYAHQRGGCLHSNDARARHRHRPARTALCRPARIGTRRAWRHSRASPRRGHLDEPHRRRDRRAFAGRRQSPRPPWRGGDYAFQIARPGDRGPRRRAPRLSEGCRERRGQLDCAGWRARGHARRAARVTTPTLAASTLDEIVAARARISGTALRTPLVRLYVDSPADIWLKLECLQPIGSFKLRGATNAMRRLAEEAPERLGDGAYTASAGHMAQGVAWGARALGIACPVVVPDTAPATKLAAIERLGARIDTRPFDAWWRVIAAHGDARMPGTFIHPFADSD